jgi:RluA family pseudouridine synthase
MHFTYKIKSEERVLSLLQFLTKKYTYYSLEDWKAQITKEKILVNGEKAEFGLLLNENDEISFLKEDFEEPFVDDNFSVVYEDEFLFAINKSGNLPVHPAGRYRKKNLTTILQNSGRKSSETFIINRLDRETSGIVLFGKSSLAASRLGKLFARGLVKKTYISYVEGLFPEKIIAKGFLSKDDSSEIRKKKKFSYQKPNNSLWEVDTDFELINTFSQISKIYAYPHTGKIHQIRATLYSIGYPVVGDKIYGYDENLFLKFIETGISENKFNLQRQALHAYRLEFNHPFTDSDIIIQAEEPDDMLSLARN